MVWMKGPVDPFKHDARQNCAKDEGNCSNRNVIHSCWKAWFSMCIAPMDSSNSQCLLVTVKAKQKKWHQGLVLEKEGNDRDDYIDF